MNFLPYDEDMIIKIAEVSMKKKTFVSIIILMAFAVFALAITAYADCGSCKDKHNCKGCPTTKVKKGECSDCKDCKCNDHDKDGKCKDCSGQHDCKCGKCKDGCRCKPKYRGKCGSGYHMITLGNRIPKDYFVTTGKGDTDIGPGDDPWETGSYDLALMDAKIENFNVMVYTSVLPPESREIDIEQAKKSFHHGAVVETIMAVVNGVKGNTLCTGVGRIWVRRKSDGKLIGGFAAEYEKVHKKQVTVAAAEKAAKKMLHVSLMGEVNRRYDSKKYDFFGETHKITTFTVKKKYGTCLTALCWVNYIYPKVRMHRRGCKGCTGKSGKCKSDCKGK